MPWYIWLLVADLILSALFKVATVGESRKALTPLDAVGAVIVTALYVWGVLHFGGMA